MLIEELHDCPNSLRDIGRHMLTCDVRQLFQCARTTALEGFRSFRHRSIREGVHSLASDEEC